MMSWWKEKARPWLNKNRGYLLLGVVILALVATLVVVLTRGPEVVTVDPVRAADQRALEEAQLRAASLEAENTRLRESLVKIEQEHDMLLNKVNIMLSGDVESLRGDPQALLQLMREINRR